MKDLFPEELHNSNTKSTFDKPVGSAVVSERGNLTLGEKVVKYVSGGKAVMGFSSSLLDRTKYCTAERGDHAITKVGLAGDHCEGDEDDEALAEAVLDHQVVELGEVGGALCKEEVSGVGGKVEEDEEGEEETGAAGQPGSRSKCAGEGQHLVNKIQGGFFNRPSPISVPK